jgi:hypothetical protein
MKPSKLRPVGPPHNRQKRGTKETEIQKMPHLIFIDEGVNSHAGRHEDNSKDAADPIVSNRSVSFIFLKRGQQL